VTPQRATYLVLFVAMFGVWLAVVLTYHFMSGGRWRHTPEGRHVMVFGIIFVWVSGLILANMAFGRYPGRFLVGVVSYGSFVAIGAQRLVMIIRAQRARRQLASARMAASRAPSDPTG
jgi:hypothetical protein